MSETVLPKVGGFSRYLSRCWADLILLVWELLRFISARSWLAERAFPGLVLLERLWSMLFSLSRSLGSSP